MVVPEVEELGEGDPVVVARENALLKVNAVPADGAEAVLAVDTLVALDGRLYGKPRDAEHATEMLEALSGREHLVVSGLALRRDGRTEVVDATTRVRFRDLQGMLHWYVRTGEWRERAGAYAIQGRGAALVRGIEGDYLNVVGLPVSALVDIWPGILEGAR